MWPLSRGVRWSLLYLATSGDLSGWLSCSSPIVVHFESFTYVKTCVGSNPVAYPVSVFDARHSIVYRALGALHVHLATPSAPFRPPFCIRRPLECQLGGRRSAHFSNKPPRSGTPGWLFINLPAFGGSVHPHPPFRISHPSGGGGSRVAFTIYPF